MVEQNEIDKRVVEKDNSYKMLERALEVTKNGWKELSGGVEPDENSDLWQWYMVSQFDTNLKLLVTLNKKKDEQ